MDQTNSAGKFKSSRFGLSCGHMSNANEVTETEGIATIRAALEEGVTFPGNLEKNVELVGRLAQIAAEKNITVAQLAYAWMISKGDDILPLIGASKPGHFLEAARAGDIHLDDTDIRRIEAAVPEHEIAGASFPNMQFRNGAVVRP